MNTQGKFSCVIKAEDRRNISIYRYYLRHCSSFYKIAALLIFGSGIFIYFTMTSERHPLFTTVFFLAVTVGYAFVRWIYAYLDRYDPYPILWKDDYCITFCADRLIMKANGKQAVICVFCPSWPKNKHNRAKDEGPLVIAVHECESGLYFSIPLVFGPLAFVSKDKFDIQSYKSLREMLGKAFGAKYRQV